MTPEERAAMPRLKKEQLIIGTLMNNIALLPDMLAQGLTAEHFREPFHRATFEALVDLYKERRRKAH